jgi:hypothetical protein
VASGGDEGVGGKLMVTRGTGRRVREALGEVLEGLPGDGVLYVDTRGVELMDYSFADEALGILVSRVAAGEYGDRHVALVEEDRELLENIEASLRQRGLAMIRVDEPGGDPKIVGEVSEHLLETLRADLRGRRHHQRRPRREARYQPHRLQQPCYQALQARPYTSSQEHCRPGRPSVFLRGDRLMLFFVFSLTHFSEDSNIGAVAPKEV